MPLAATAHRLIPGFRATGIAPLLHMFTQGQSVVCIDDTFPDWVESLYVALPTKGTTYTIRDISPWQNLELDPEVAVTLQELHNPIGKGGLERAFNAERFEPIDLDAAARSDRQEPGQQS